MEARSGFFLGRCVLMEFAYKTVPPKMEDLAEDLPNGRRSRFGTVSLNAAAIGSGGTLRARTANVKTLGKESGILYRQVFVDVRLEFITC